MASASPVEVVRDSPKECSICTDILVDPRALPCTHISCLSCLEQTFKGNQPGDSVPCPLCRRTFIIPTTGLSNLPTEVPVEVVNDSKAIPIDSAPGEESSDAQAVPENIHDPMCDVCLCRKIESIAETFCVACQQNLCQQCLELHQMFGSGKSHPVVSVKKGSNVEELPEHLVKYCDRHVSEKADIYCFECQNCFCKNCSVEEHGSHTCSNINEVLTDLKGQIRKETTKTDYAVMEVNEASTIMVNLLKDFEVNVKETEREITQRVEEMKSAIDKHAQEAIKCLKYESSIKRKEIKDMNAELIAQKLTFESSKRYAEGVINTTDPDDVPRKIACLDRMSRDRRLAKIFHVRTYPKVSFDSAKFTSFESCVDNNIVGRIIMSDNEFAPTFWKSVTYAKSPNQINTISIPNNCVRGISTIAKKIFVVIHNSGEILVFDSETFAPQDNIPVNGLTNPWDMTSVRNLLFVSDINGEIYRVELPQNLVTSWSVGRGCASLSITKNGNLLIASKEMHTLYEYTLDGIQQREIALQDGIKNPQRAIQLDNDQFLVCQIDSEHVQPCFMDKQGELVVGLYYEGKIKQLDRYYTHEPAYSDRLSGHHRICLIGNKGQLIKSFGSTFGKGVDKLNHPYRVVVDPNGSILVADYGNNRIVILYKDLKYVREIQISDSFCFTLFIDECEGKLYVSVDKHYKRRQGDEALLYVYDIVGC